MDSMQKLKKSFGFILVAGLVLLTILRFDQVIAVLASIVAVLMPLFVGVIIAYILNLIVKVFEKIYFPKSTNKWVNHTRHAVSVVLACVFMVLFFIFIITLIAPQIVSILSVLSKQLPVLYEELITYANQTLKSFPDIQKSFPELPDDIDQMFVGILSQMTGGALNVAGSAIGSVIGVLISVIFALYLLFSRDFILHQFTQFSNVYLAKNTREQLSTLYRVTDTVFSKFFIGQAVEALILGALCTIGMLILGFPYPSMIGTLVGITSLIPMFGAYIGGILGFLIILAENPYQAIAFVIFLIILQQVEGNLIYPRVVGASVGLPGIYVFVAVIVFGGLFGIPGVLFGIPTAATVYKLIQQDIQQKIT